MANFVGNNNRDLTERNRSAIVKILQQQGVCSRAEIARQTNLTQAAITKLVAVLLDMQLVLEVGNIKGRGNRRSIGLMLNAQGYRVLGVKLTRHMFSLGVFDLAGNLCWQQELAYAQEQTPSVTLAALKSEIHKALVAFGNIIAIGMAVPGPYLREEGKIASMTKLPMWHNVNFLEALKDEFDIPIYIAHDAKAGAMASWWFGQHAHSMRTLAYLLVGDGIGAGIVERGQILFGAHGAAGEIGHISMDVNGPRCECGNHGCFECYCTVPILWEQAKKQLGTALVDTTLASSQGIVAVFQLARAGNQQAMHWVEQAARYIGYGCITLMNAYNPDVIVIGDCIAQGGDLLLPTILHVVQSRVIPELYTKVKIQISDLSVDPTLCGAAAIATDRVMQTPSAFCNSTGARQIKKA